MSKVKLREEMSKKAEELEEAIELEMQTTAQQSDCQRKTSQTKVGRTRYYQDGHEEPLQVQAEHQKRVGDEIR